LVSSWCVRDASARSACASARVSSIPPRSGRAP
jgi:hypothetical protein